MAQDVIVGEPQGEQALRAAPHLGRVVVDDLRGDGLTESQLDRRHLGVARGDQSGPLVGVGHVGACRHVAEQEGGFLRVHAGQPRQRLAACNAAAAAQ